MGGAVGENEAGSILERHVIGDLAGACGIGQHVGGETAVDGQGKHPVADSEIGDSFANRLDLSGDLATGGEGAVPLAPGFRARRGLRSAWLSRGLSCLFDLDRAVDSAPLSTPLCRAIFAFRGVTQRPAGQSGEDRCD